MKTLSKKVWLLVASTSLVVICGSIALAYFLYRPTYELKLELSKVELAQTPEQREIGLMYREQLCDTCGMIFIFDTPNIQRFWMKNTKISLDMIFVDQNFIVTDIYQNTIPLQESPTYDSTRQSKYVIEVPAGYVQKHTIPSPKDRTIHINNLQQLIDSY